MKKNMKNIKNALLLLSVLICLPLIGAEAPPRLPSATSFNNLPNDVKRLITSSIASNNVEEVAQTILSLNKTNRFFRNFVRSEAGLISIFEQMPYTANALYLSERLENNHRIFPMIRNLAVTKWLTNAAGQLRYGPELYNAVSQNNIPEIQRLLKDKNINLNWHNVNHSGKTALMNSYFYPTIVRMLLDAGANPNAIDSSGKTALIYASAHELPEVLTMLLNAGADPDRQDSTHQDTALIQSIQWNNPENVRVLLAAGANPNLETHGGTTALKLAMHMNYKEIIDMLLKAGVIPSRPAFEPSVYKKVTGSRATNATAYQILGVPVGATQEQIKNAYKQKSLLWHPDKNPDYQAGQAFALIAWAYDQLK